MIDPNKDPLLSIVLSGQHLQACVQMLKTNPIADINRPCALNGNVNITSGHVSVLEAFLTETSSNCSQPTSEPFALSNNLPEETLVAIELVQQGASFSNTGTWTSRYNQNEPRSFDVLDIAFECGHFTFVEYLIDGPLSHKAADLGNRITLRGVPWMEEIVHKEQWSLARTLQRLGADVNTPNDRGRTLLFYCTNEKAVAELVGWGADASVVDNAGQSVSDAWMAKLSAAQVKKMNAALFTSLKKQGSLDLSVARDQWMNMLLSSTKGVLTEQAKRVRINSDFVWNYENATVQPLTWLVTNKRTRSAVQHGKVVDAFVPQRDCPLMLLPSGEQSYNDDVLALFDAFPEEDYNKRHISNMSRPSVLDNAQWLEHTLAGIARGAIAVQSLPWDVSDSSRARSFRFYFLLLPSCSLNTAHMADFTAQLKKASGRDFSVQEVTAALYGIKRSPLKVQLEQCCLEHGKREQNKMYALTETSKPVLAGSQKEEDLRNAFWPFVSDLETRYYNHVNYVFNPFENRTGQEVDDFKVLAEKVIECLNGSDLGLAFDDAQWQRIQRASNRHTSVVKEEAKGMLDKFKMLVGKNTIARELSVPVETATKRKM